MPTIIEKLPPKVNEIWQKLQTYKRVNSVTSKLISRYNHGKSYTYFREMYFFKIKLNIIL